MRQFLLTLTLLCLTLLPAMAAEPFAQIPPPQLVPCTSPTNCDRNPKHLEAFVEGFYRWYAYSIDLRFSKTLENYSTQKREALIKKIDETHEENIEHYLTPKFYTWRNIARNHYGENLKNSHYCSPDSEAITCSQDWGEGDLGSMKIRKLYIRSKTAKFIVQFSNNHRLFLHLKAHDGFWKINSVNRYTY